MSTVDLTEVALTGLVCVFVKCFHIGDLAQGSLRAQQANTLSLSWVFSPTLIFLRHFWGWGKGVMYPRMAQICCVAEDDLELGSFFLHHLSAEVTDMFHCS